MLPILCAIDYLGVLILLKSDCVELPLLSGSEQLSHWILVVVAAACSM